MIKAFVNQWEENKHLLAEHLTNVTASDISYEYLVKKVFDIAVPTDGNGYNWNTKRMTVIDHGEYQGTQLFIIPRDCYQPSDDEYIVTSSYYGSCSSCDTLLAICAENSWEENFKPSQVAQLMTMALHIVQRTKWLMK